MKNINRIIARLELIQFLNDTISSPDIGTQATDVLGGAIVAASAKCESGDTRTAFELIVSCLGPHVVHYAKQLPEIDVELSEYEIYGQSVTMAAETAQRWNDGDWLEADEKLCVISFPDSPERSSYTMIMHDANEAGLFDGDCFPANLVRRVE